MSKNDITNGKELPDLPSDIKRQLTTATKLAAKAKGLIAEGETLKEKAKDILLPLMSAYEVKTYVVGGVGNVGARVSNGSSINDTKLREALLVAGVKVKVINEAITKATKTWNTDYVQFTAAKQ